MLFDLETNYTKSVSEMFYFSNQTKKNQIWIRRQANYVFQHRRIFYYIHHIFPYFMTENKIDLKLPITAKKKELRLPPPSPNDVVAPASWSSSVPSRNTNRPQSFAPEWHSHSVHLGQRMPACTSRTQREHIPSGIQSADRDSGECSWCLRIRRTSPGCRPPAPPREWTWRTGSNPRRLIK